MCFMLTSNLFGDALTLRCDPAAVAASDAQTSMPADRLRPPAAPTR